MPEIQLHHQRQDLFLKAEQAKYSLTARDKTDVAVTHGGAREKIALTRIAPGVGQHEVVGEVHRIAPPRHEVIDCAASVKPGIAVEALVLLQIRQDRSEVRQVGAGRAEQEVFEVHGLTQQALVLVELPDELHPRRTSEASDEGMEAAQVARDAGSQNDRVPGRLVLVEELELAASERLELPEGHHRHDAFHPGDQRLPLLVVAANVGLVRRHAFADFQHAGQHLSRLPRVLRQDPRRVGAPDRRPRCRLPPVVRDELLGDLLHRDLELAAGVVAQLDREVGQRDQQGELVARDELALVE